jgi:hypothetical protein
MLMCISQRNSLYFLVKHISHAKPTCWQNIYWRSIVLLYKTNGYMVRIYKEHIILMNTLMYVDNIFYVYITWPRWNWVKMVMSCCIYNACHKSTASDYPFRIFKLFLNEISFTSSLYHKIFLGVRLCFPLSVRICFSPERK